MNKKTKEYGYLQFPLCLLKETYSNPELGLNLIIDYGIVNYASKLSYDLQDVAKQVCYYYYRKYDVLQASIKNKIAQAEEDSKFSRDDDYNGFSGDTFQPDDNISEILSLFDEDSQFKKDCILYYQLHVASSTNHLNVSIMSNDNTIKRHKIASKIKKDFESKYGPDAMPMCKVHMLFDFRDKQQKDIILFQAYIGIRSIIGMNYYMPTHKIVILCRMLGCKTNIALQAFLKENESARDIYKKYSGRKRMDNLLYKLAERGFITMVSKKHESRIYVSVKYQNPVELAEAILKKRESNNLKKQLRDASEML